MVFEIKAIIFDYGNVLCLPQPAEDIQAMAAAVNMPLDDFTKIYWRDRTAYDRAEMEPPEYWGRLTGRQLDAAEVAKLVDLDNRSWTHPNEKTLAYVDAAKRKHLRTALLSNLPAGLKTVLENDCNWLPDFDVRTYSCDVRKTKPDPGIYEECVRALGVKHPEAVFLDDRPENVKGAMEIGIRAVLFQSAEQALTDLRTQYGVNLQPDGRPAGLSRAAVRPVRT